MDLSDAVLVFILIYLVVMAALYLASKYWAALKSSRAGARSIQVPTSPSGAFLPAETVSSAVAFRPAAPRPPRLRPPPLMGLHDAAALRSHARRLSLCARVVGYVASVNPTGFPIGLFREWYEARRPARVSTDLTDAGEGLAEALRDVPADDAAYDAIVAEFASSATYAEMADLVHFCGEAFAAAKSGSPVHAMIHQLSDRLAVVVTVDHASADEEDRRQLERRLEVDGLAVSADKIAHLRRMHGFFRARLISLRDDGSAERRTERMADCRRHMEEHERLLGWLGAQA